MPELPRSTQRTFYPHPFRRAVLGGLGVVLPPLLTVVLFIWAWNTIETSVLRPVESLARWLVVQVIWDVQHEVPDGAILSSSTDPPTFDSKGVTYARLASGDWVPEEHVMYLRQWVRPVPSQAGEFFDEYVRARYLSRWRVIPLFLAGFILVMYLLGKFLAAGVGGFLWSSFERLIHRLPLIRNVYSSVKQVTDFMLSDRNIDFNRVIAVEYPRKGIWSIGFVTGEGMLDVRSAANEPVLTVLLPTSPMPATGFTIFVKKSETVDLNLTLDQAIQLIVSCGVVIPPHQQGEGNAALKITAALPTRNGDREASSNGGPAQRPHSTLDPDGPRPEPRSPSQIDDQL